MNNETGELLPSGLINEKLDHSIRFSHFDDEIARIDPDGIMHFTVDATDKNAEKFIECIELCMKRRLNGLKVEKK